MRLRSKTMACSLSTDSPKGRVLPGLCIIIPLLLSKQIVGPSYMLSIDSDLLKAASMPPSLLLRDAGENILWDYMAFSPSQA